MAVKYLAELIRRMPQVSPLRPGRAGIQREDSFRETSAFLGLLPKFERSLSCRPYGAAFSFGLRTQGVASLCLGYSHTLPTGERGNQIEMGGSLKIRV